MSGTVCAFQVHALRVSVVHRTHFRQSGQVPAFVASAVVALSSSMMIGAPVIESSIDWVAAAWESAGTPVAVVIALEVVLAVVCEARYCQLAMVVVPGDAALVSALASVLAPIGSTSPTSLTLQGWCSGECVWDRFLCGDWEYEWEVEEEGLGLVANLRSEDSVVVDHIAAPHACSISTMHAFR